MDCTGLGQLEPLDAARRLAVGAAVVLDVRQQNEWEAGRIPLAIHVPASSVAAYLEDLGDDRAVVVVCRSGNRSARVVEVLTELGYRAFNLKGGMRAWHAHELPLDPPDGCVV